MRRCADKKRRCADEKLWKYEDVKIRRREDVDEKMRWRYEIVRMWRWENKKMRKYKKGKKKKIFYKSSLLKISCTQIFSEIIYISLKHSQKYYIYTFQKKLIYSKYIYKQ